MEGNVYETVNIGTQWWMAENLKVTHYRNGEPILAISDRAECLSLSTGAYSSYENDADHIPTYGLLYNWYAVDDVQGLCPDGWHVPSDEEWKQLEMYLGMGRSDADNTDGRGTDEGGKLKAIGTIHWQSPNAGASNESGFTALPGGGRACYGTWGGNCYYMGTKASFWTSTEQDEDEAWFRNLDHDKPTIIRKANDKRVGFSVRCVQD